MLLTFYEPVNDKDGNFTMNDNIRYGEMTVILFLFTDITMQILH